MPRQLAPHPSPQRPSSRSLRRRQPHSSLALSRRSSCQPPRTLQYSYQATTLQCGRALKWYPMPDLSVEYPGAGKLIVRDPRAPDNALTFQLDAGAEKQEYTGSTGWFQTSIGYRSWLIIDLAGRIVGAGYHQNVESSYVQCGVSLVDSQRDPASILPKSTQPVVMNCSEGTRKWLSTLYMRDSLLYSVEADRTIVPLNGVKVSDGPGHVETGGSGHFSFQSETNSNEYLTAQNGELRTYRTYPGRYCYAA